VRNGEAEVESRRAKTEKRKWNRNVQSDEAEVEPRRAKRRSESGTATGETKKRKWNQDAPRDTPPGESPGKWPGGTGVPGPCGNRLIFPDGRFRRHMSPASSRRVAPSRVMRPGSQAVSGIGARHDKKVVRVEKTSREPSHASRSGVSGLGVNTVGESR
jgi:hypothetical protein